MSFKTLLPSELLTKDNGKVTTVKTESLSCEIVGFYFSAHWCPPCRGFTPKLAEFYKSFKQTEKGKKFEIIFVSSDRKDSEFEKYFAEMPWMAIPFSDPQRRALSSKWKVNGIPCFIVVNADGSVITKKGVQEVYGDSKGESFPWAPKPFWEALDGKLIDKQGSESKMGDLKGNEVIGFYFSDERLTKQLEPLVEAYEKLREKGKKLEIVLAAKSEDKSSWQAFFGKMPWKAFGFEDKRNAVAANMFEIEQIPTLILVDPASGKVISTDGTTLVTEESGEFPWTQKKSLQALKPSTLDILNSHPCLVLFPSKENTSEQVSSLQSVADEFAKKFVEQKLDEDPIRFLYANNHAVDSRVAEFLGIGAARPVVCILNIPEGCKYKFSGSQITADSVGSFVTSFLEDKLSPSPIREK